jgi:hypothetical protein
VAHGTLRAPFICCDVPLASARTCASWLLLVPYPVARVGRDGMDEDAWLDGYWEDRLSGIGDDWQDDVYGWDAEDEDDE